MSLYRIVGDHIEMQSAWSIFANVFNARLIHLKEWLCATYGAYDVSIELIFGHQQTEYVLSELTNASD